MMKPVTELTDQELKVELYRLDTFRLLKDRPRIKALADEVKRRRKVTLPGDD